jgi:peptidoglycan/xylan/chitin deacetylase (PgdA/CDA1 family)
MHRPGSTKRVLFVAISTLVFSWSTLMKLIRRLLRIKARATCVVLYYHEVRAQDRSGFARQMDLLKQCATPIPTDRTEPLIPGRHYVSVTFDDGYQSVLDNALPELRTREIPATLFIITDALGKSPHWLTAPGISAHDRPVMSEKDLQNLSAGLISVGSHTLTHPNLTKLTKSEALREIAESRTKLESILHREARLFSFPYGAYNGESIELCRQAGYQRVFTTSPRWAFITSEEFITGRVPVEPGDWPLEFRMKVMGAYRWVPLAISLKRGIRSLFKARRRKTETVPA